MLFRSDQDRAPDIGAGKRGEKKTGERDADKSRGDADQRPHAGEHTPDEYDTQAPFPALVFDPFDVVKLDPKEMGEFIHQRTTTQPGNPVGNGGADRASQGGINACQQNKAGGMPWRSINIHPAKARMISLGEIPVAFSKIIRPKTPYQPNWSKITCRMERMVCSIESSIRTSFS